ncbi:MAG: prolipoprotein diacylglyceryl transferase [Oscillospiraceae bacterium]|nr:prolipoprotein diacylglyceryl transferase [Oscillospiraceae bacterium]
MIFISYISFPNLFGGLKLNIGRTAFTVFGLNIYWYGVVITAAIILGFGYAMKRSRQFGMIADKVFDAAAAGLIGGFIGARLYYVTFYNLNPDNETKYNFITYFTGIRDGGLAIYGGIIGAALFAFVYMKLKKIKILPVLDLGGLGFLIGIGIGRWGNFFNQEAYGAVMKNEMPWGMTGSRIASETGGSVLVHPCFLYESLWCLLGLAVLHFYSKKLRTFDGEIFLLFVTWYGTGRAFNESLRTDSLMLGSLRISQILAAVTAGAAIGIFIYFKKKVVKSGKTALYSQTEESELAIIAYEKKLKLDKEKADAKKALKKEDETAPSILADAGDNAPHNDTEGAEENGENY